MRRLITLVCAVTAATWLVVGCSSSSDTSSTSSGGSTSTGGSGGGASDVKCVGSYTDLTQSAFTAKVSSTGMCANSSDETAVCTNDVTTIAEQCGGSCFQAGGTDAVQDGCTSTCLSSMVTPALSSACQTCYVSDVACARKNCLLSCGLAPTSAGCATCRQMNGCVDAFYSCSGVPVPGSSTTTGSGGAADEAAAGASTAG
jgi:hypothetical protein